MKRPANDGLAKGSISPPPTRRKIESTVTKKVVDNFFKPASEKEPEHMQWRVVDKTLLVGTFRDSQKQEGTMPERRKIAAFDFDSTLIRTSSGNVFGKDAHDWAWWDSSVPGKLRELDRQGFLVAIVSNQGGLNLEADPKSLHSDRKRLSAFKEKASYVLNQLGIPLSIYAATERDRFRKPRTGMWSELLDEHDLDIGDGPDLARSFFVGDAGGRLAVAKIKADHSVVDRDFAANAGIAFKTPEEFFLDEEARPFKRLFDPRAFVSQPALSITESQDPHDHGFQKANALDIVLLCGSPGAGKSTYFWSQLEPHGYERVNQDLLKTRDKCVKLAGEHLSSRRPVAIDNTNADVETRRVWVNLAKKHSVPVRCVVLATPVEVCRHNDAVRALNETLFFNPEKRSMLPGMAFSGFASRFKEPTFEEGFQDIIRVSFTFHGSAEQKEVWSKYWT